MGAVEPTKTLRRDLPAEERRTPALLAVVVGGALARRSVALRGTVTVGRGQDASLVLEDESISRRHFVVAWSGEAWALTDAGSRNGTFVDGHATEGSTPLRVGSVVRAGASILVVVEDASRARDPVTASLGLVGGGSLGPLRRRIETVAPSPSPALILGQTGSGKELVARALHDASGRTGALVAANCAAIPQALFESELFGHARGAYSGASTARPGLVRSAQGGTLFLDEIGELPLELQPKLLRFLEDGLVRPVGDDHGRPVDARVVAATHRDLRARVEQGAFREDLFHRLSGARLELPSLEERREDIPELAAHLLAREDAGQALSVDALERLLCAPWRGNVRELRNVVLDGARTAQAEGSVRIEARHLEALAPPEDPDAPGDARRGPQDPRRDAIVQALRAASGNVTEAAERLGMRRATVYELMKKLGIDPRAHR
jgi:transcriptional regulator with GAF, ATPase, and Fis domain